MYFHRILSSIKRFCVSYDVTFLEDQPFYSHDSLKEENSNIKNHWDPSISLPISLSHSPLSFESPPSSPLEAYLGQGKRSVQQQGELLV